MDASGNVVVTGHGARRMHDGQVFGWGRAIVGQSLQSRLPGSVPESKGIMAVDASGNVVVTGYSGDGPDYVTIKYSSAGVPLWTNRYNGPGNGNDRYTPWRWTAAATCL